MRKPEVLDRELRKGVSQPGFHRLDQRGQERGCYYRPKVVPNYPSRNVSPISRAERDHSEAYFKIYDQAISYFRRSSESQIACSPSRI